jgi:hypothetical protein
MEDYSPVLASFFMLILIVFLYLSGQVNAAIFLTACIVLYFIYQALTRKYSDEEDRKTKYPWLSGTPFVDKPKEKNDITDEVVREAEGVNKENMDHESQIIHEDEPVPVRVKRKSTCDYCGAHLINWINDFHCSICDGWFCVNHRIHGSHQDSSTEEAKKLRLSIIGRCESCHSPLNAINKMYCIDCRGTFCTQHIHVKNGRHGKIRCVPVKSPEYGHPVKEYLDGTRVIYMDRKISLDTEIHKTKRKKKKNRD